MKLADNERRVKQLSVTVWSAFVVMFVCSFLPWMAVGPLSVSGTELSGDGRVTAALAVFAAILYLGRELTDHWLRVFLGLLSCATAAIGLAVYASNVAEVSRSNDGATAISPHFEVGIGLNLGTAASAIAACLLAVAVVRDVWVGSSRTVTQRRANRRSGRA